MYFFLPDELPLIYSWKTIHQDPLKHPPEHRVGDINYLHGVGYKGKPCTLTNIEGMEPRGNFLMSQGSCGQTVLLSEH